MPRYMTQYVCLSSEESGLLGQPPASDEALCTRFQQHGGRVVTIHHALGDCDGTIIFEAPDAATAEAAVSAALAGYRVAAKQTTLIGGPTVGQSVARR